MAALLFVWDGPPVSSFEDAFDEIGVVAEPDEGSITCLRIWCSDVHGVGIVDFP